MTLQETPMKHAILTLVSLIAAAALIACGDQSATANQDSDEADAAATAEATDSAGSYENLSAVAAAPWRPEEDSARDEWRHPAETLEFFGVDPSGAVAEVWPGRGYYARILAPWIAANGGTYYAIHPADMSTDDGADERQAFEAAFPDDVFGDIHHGSLTGESGQLVDNPASLDAVLTFRNVHNWVGRGFDQKAFNDFYAALKPGGVLGVVEHRLPSGQSDIRASSGYVAVEYVRSLADEAGFEFVEASEINANPADTADHPFGVWTLPPSRRSPEPGSPEAENFDRAAFDAIGESDRMTLLFRKPLESPQAAADGAEAEAEDSEAGEAGAEPDSE